MYRRVIGTALFVGLLLTCFGVRAQEPSYRAKLRELMEATHAVEMARTAFDQLFGSVRSAVPDVPDEVWEGFREKFRAEGIDDYIDRLAPVYARHLSEADLDTILAFYRTPAGRRMAERMPQIQTEAQAVGQQWGMELMQELIGELKAAGALPQAADD